MKSTTPWRYLSFAATLGKSLGAFAYEVGTHAAMSFYAWSRAQISAPSDPAYPNDFLVRHGLAEVDMKRPGDPFGLRILISTVMK